MILKLFFNWEHLGQYTYIHTACPVDGVVDEIRKFKKRKILINNNSSKITRKKYMYILRKQNKALKTNNNNSDWQWQCFKWQSFKERERERNCCVNCLTNLFCFLVSLFLFLLFRRVLFVACICVSVLQNSFCTTTA